MTRDEARQYIIDRYKDYLKPDRSKKGFICPICNSGSGKSGTGITTKDNGEHFTCWTGCYTNASLVDIIGLQYGLTAPADMFAKAYEIFNIKIDDTQYTTHNTQESRKAMNENKTTAQETVIDFTSFFLEANKNIGQTDYAAKRGLSIETLNRHCVGYVAEWKHPTAADTAPATPRLILPISKYSYTARDTRKTIPTEQEAYKKQKVKGKEKVIWTFNSKALQTATQPVFVVEGEIDALSIIEVGGEAVGIGSIAYIRGFLKLCEDNKPTQPLIIALDNENSENVAKAQRELVEGLQRLNIPCYTFSPYGTHKDANEALVADREAFKEKVAEIVAEIENTQGAEAEAEAENYLRNSTANYIQTFLDNIANKANNPCIPTGFNNLDKELSGGLYEGLYFIGAISSLGKTTFVTQAADQMAKAGTDILIFSLEMSREQLMAKSVSRHTHRLKQEKYSKNPAITPMAMLDITNGSRYATYSKAQKDFIAEAVEAYSEYAKHIYIVEAEGKVGAAEVRETVEKHIKYTGKTPVVIIDYLQILAPADPRATEKQNTDAAVLELKRLSRDYKMAVIGVSSFNRDNYNSSVSMEAFKESGAIEYSSDVLIGLQFKAAVAENGKEVRNAATINEAKRKDPREVELVILKNRNGKTGGKLSYKYYPAYNNFVEA